MINLRYLLLSTVLASGGLWAQSFPAGYNNVESAVKPYTALDPLTFNDGSAVTAKTWPKRRAQILGMFEENVFGRTPAAAKALPVRAHLDEQDDHALSGKAIRKQITLYFSPEGEDGPKEHLLLYLPAASKGKTPVVLGMSFAGNQSIVNDPGIRLNPTWTRPPKSTEPPHLEVPAEKTRGAQTQQWQVEKVLARGYGIATIYYGDLEPDYKDAVQLGIRPYFYAAGQTATAADDWGAIGVWAWGLSRALDYLVTDPLVDGSRVAVTGHSRLGKTADWAAAQDTRFAAVLSTESGKGGQSLSRRVYGETVKHLEDSFPYWFCANYAKWVDRDTEIPVDGNLMTSLMAPRPLYVASAEGDQWSDPKGEFLSAVSASRVYELLGKPGISTAAMPAVDQPTDPARFVAYHVRSGKHDVTAFDWDQYLNFLDAHFGRQR
jgi:hypothetical protein